MRVPALGEAATQLPWLAPYTASLLTLARSPAAGAWVEVRHDPGAVLLIVRQAAGSLSPPGLSFFPSVLGDPAILEGALHFLTGDGRLEAGGLNFHAQPPASSLQPPASGIGFVDWSRPSLRPIYQASVSYARLAHRLAECTGRCDAENAWVAGLLAPLGWLAVCAIDPDQAVACLNDPELAKDPARVQQRYWGYHQASIARRLLRRWRVPRWLALVVGHLGLPVEIAQTLGADPDLLRTVQLAVALVQQSASGLHLLVGAEPAENAAALGLPPREQEALIREEAEKRKSKDEREERLRPFPFPLSSWERTWVAPHGVPFLRDLLYLAIENQRLRDAPTLQQLERDQDQLHQALEKQRTGETDRLEALKLLAVAELAAGAAHEINNPLAVISGQAQYLLGREAERAACGPAVTAVAQPPGATQRALQTIIGQAQRIHQVLTDLMQFARPPRPQRQMVDVRSVVRDVSLSLSDLARQRQVQLQCPEPDAALHLHADPRQIRTALECLLRNAIEAAPIGGWARLRLETATAERLELVVEDSGSGPAPAQRDHLFNPFFCGRQAGRGRGLGLPTAWRLAREHGGDVRFDGAAGAPTRFVLSLPREGSANGHSAASQGPGIQDQQAKLESTRGSPPQSTG